MGQRHPFRFGIINEQPLAADDWFAQLRRIEAWGYDTFLIRDHLAPHHFGPQYGPVAAMASAAAVTTTLRVGTMVVDNDFRHPAVLAKEIATIDQLSGGRVELGIGAGWLREEYQQTGIAFDSAGVRIERLEESIQILKRLFSGEETTFAGQHYRLEGLTSFPSSLTRPHPPLMIGGGKRRVLTLAGREADIVGILTSSVETGTLVSDPRERLPEAVYEKLSWVRDGAGARFDDIELSLVPTVIQTGDPQRAAAELIESNGWHGVSVADVLSMPSVLIGDTDDIVSQLCACRERYGFSYFVLSDSEAEAFAPVVARLGRGSRSLTPTRGA